MKQMKQMKQMKHQRRSNRRKPTRIVTTGATVVAAIAIAAGISLFNKSSNPPTPLPVHLPTTPQSYLGVSADPAPASYAGVTAFKGVTGVSPDVIMYYCGWFEPFQTSFAETVAKQGAVPLVQINPTGIRVASIASGRYDGYLSSYAEAVRAYGHPVILSFGHEMNGNWYSWGYRNTTPAAFVAAWRHIVTLFRVLGARNVTWLWTVNIINDTQDGQIPGPAPWWPGSSYVTWVGIDGYYLEPNWQFAPLFGPTIAAVRALTGDPILIAETAVATAADQPAQIADLFAGIRAYGLLGFVWFDASNIQDFRISSPAAIAAFGRGATTTYLRPAS
jgi:mannan endo-1,4-beta-mannosidase